MGAVCPDWCVFHAVGKAVAVRAALAAFDPGVGAGKVRSRSLFDRVGSLGGDQSIRSEWVAAGQSRVSKVAKPTGGVQLEQGKMQRLGRTVLTCDGVTVEVGGRQILRDFSCEFTRGARVGVVGPNGAGKSTLLKALQQKLPLAAGEISCGETVAQRVDRARCPA